MQAFRTFPKLDECPQCGKPEGAAKGSSRWGHDEMCCSDLCGYAYRFNPRHALAKTRHAREIEAEARREAIRWTREADRLTSMRPVAPVIAHVLIAREEEDEVDRNLILIAEGPGWLNDLSRRRAPDSERKAAAAWLAAIVALLAWVDAGDGAR
jgi:hypothetical protein